MRLDVQLPDALHTILIGAGQHAQRISDILRSQDLPLNTRCGERDMCAGCMIDLVDGMLEHLDTGETVSAPRAELRGCRYRLLSDSIISVPERSRLAYAPQVLDSYRVNVPYAKDPLPPHGLGVAIDVGTTTVVVRAIDASTGTVVGSASAFNRQMHYGEDVLTRINYCATDPSMTERLQAAIVRETIQPLLAEALGERPIDDVEWFSVAGNTTMLHLLVGSDPSSLGVAPFTPGFLEREPFPASSIGLEPGRALVCLLPCISAYLGADLSAGLFTSGLLYADRTSLLVDIGTNGEILLQHEGRTYGCATAAGPAFEGSGLSGGIRAGEGAISHIEIDPETFAVRREKIGPPGMRPTGICGSAYVDFLASGRRAGLLSPAGRLQGPAVAPSPSGALFQVALGQGKRPISISDADIAKLLQAKAAIAAGVLTLLRRHGLGPSDVETLFLAGGFGMHLDLDNAIACGLLPGFEPGQIQLVGNTSLGGATLVLLDRNIRGELSRAGREVEVVELNLDPGFEDTYIDQLSLP